MGQLRQGKSEGNAVRLPQKIHNFSTGRQHSEKAPLPGLCGSFRAKTLPSDGQVVVKRQNEPEFCSQELEGN
jgi:hypothetical protein